MTLDKEEHRQFLLNAIAAASVQGNLKQIREFVKMADEVEAALRNADVCAPLLGDNLHA